MLTHKIKYHIDKKDGTFAGEKFAGLTQPHEMLTERDGAGAMHSQ
jgi:hypothetical protein